jgi:TolA-binding protein
LLPAPGCVSNPFKKSDPVAPKGEGVVLRNGEVEKDNAEKSKAVAELEAGKELFAKKDYKKAEAAFTKVADNTKAGPQVAEEARFYEAECQRLLDHLPDAAGTYRRQLKDYPTGAYQQQALKQLFAIADYWLNDTRKVMEARKEQQDGKRTWVMPVSLIHIDKTKPLFDMEGEAVRTLEAIYLNDPTGPLGVRALWFIGNVRFFHQDYRDADFYFAQIIEHYPNHELASHALEMSIMCKQLMPGGPEYDCREVSNARKLVIKAKDAYPELASTKSEFLHRQMQTISHQEAARDFGIAQFYERTYHPGAAYFQYEVVRRRYPGSKFAEDAAKRMDVLRERAQKEQQKNTPRDAQAAPAGLPAPGGPAPGSPYQLGMPMMAPGQLPLTGDGR